MGERLELQQRAVQSAAMSARTGKQSYSSLLDRNEALEEKLKEARKKISLSEMQKSLLGAPPHLIPSRIILPHLFPLAELR